MTSFTNRVIILDAEQIRQISKQLNKSLPTVYAALNYTTQSPLARLIRTMAIERGGKLMAEVPDEKVKQLL